jgi:excisionase family DNA binding protein
MKTNLPNQIPISSVRLLNLQQTADLLGVSVRTVHRYIAAGQLASLVLGGRTRRIRNTALEDFLERMEAGIPTEGTYSPKQMVLGISAAQKEPRHD